MHCKTNLVRGLGNRRVLPSNRERMSRAQATIVIFSRAKPRYLFVRAHIKSQGYRPELRRLYDGNVGAVRHQRYRPNADRLMARKQ